MAICAGCDRDSKNIEEYDKDNPVEEDGTYSCGKFVCTNCYVQLIHSGQDIGSPDVLQKRAEMLKPY